MGSTRCPAPAPATSWFDRALGQHHFNWGSSSCTNPSIDPPAPASRMTTGLPLPLQYRLSRRPPPMATRRCGWMYAVWSNKGEGVRWLSAASASIEDASTAQTLAAGRKLRRDTCIAPTSLQWRPVESEPVYPPILPGSIDPGGLVDN